MRFRFHAGVDGVTGEPLVFPIYFRTDDPARPEGLIRIRVAAVRGGLRVVPALVNYGALAVGTTAEETVTLRESADCSNLTVRLTCSHPEHFDAEWRPNAVGADDAIGKIVVRLRATQATRIDGTIVVQTNLSNGTLTTIPVRGEILGLARVFPDKFVLPRTVADERVSWAECHIQSISGRALAVEIVEKPPSYDVELHSNDAANTVAMVRVQRKVGVAGRVVQHLKQMLRQGSQQQIITLPLTWLAEAGP